jgi:hypothetical protein
VSLASLRKRFRGWATKSKPTRNKNQIARNKNQIRRNENKMTFRAADRDFSTA